MIRHAPPSILLSFVQAFGFIALLATLFSLLGRYHFLPDILTHFRMQSMVGTLLPGIILLIFAKQRSRWLGGVLTVAGLAILIQLSPYFIPKSDKPEGATQTLLVHNVLTSNEQHQEVIDHILEVNPDFLVLIEIDQIWRIKIEEALSDVYPHGKYMTRDDYFGIAAYSKVPFISAEIEYWGELKVPSLDLVVPGPDGEPLRIVGTHPKPPMNAHDRRLHKSHMEETAAAIVSAPPMPTIVCGDFNTAPWCSTYSDFLATTGLQDGAIGKGIFPTWNRHTSLLGLPIDHVVVSPDIGVSRRWIGPNCGSDHRPVIVDYFRRRTGGKAMPGLDESDT